MYSDDRIHASNDLISGSLMENAQVLTVNINQETTKLPNQDEYLKLFTDGHAAYRDYDNHGVGYCLNRAISKFEALVEMLSEDDTRRPGVLNNLGIFLLRRFERSAKIEDLGSAIERLEAAVRLMSDGDPLKPRRLNDLAKALQTRFGILGDPTDSSRSITYHDAAIHLSPEGDPDKCLRLGELGTSLKLRFTQIGDLADINRAITVNQAILGLIPDRHPHTYMYRYQLGTCLFLRFERLGDPGDIDGAINQVQAAIDLTPDDHPQKPFFHHSLTSFLRQRFETRGELADIDRAISQVQTAIDLTPNDHPNKPRFLGNLGTCLQARFQRLETLEDLNRAISEIRTAVDLLPDNDIDKPDMLDNLGLSLRARFNKLGNLSDINEAITQLQAAVELTADKGFRKASFLSTLGACLGLRFFRLKGPVDINDAIIHQREAIDITPANHPMKGLFLFALGGSLEARFEHLGDPADADDAIIQTQTAINLLPEGHPQKATSLDSLGNIFWNRFLRLHDPRDADISISHFCASAKDQFGSPFTRLIAAQRWIHVAHRITHHSLLTAYDCAVSLMPVVAWLGLPMSNRHERLVRMGGIVRDAAAAAISLEQYDKALEWLEQGRSIVWGQILQLRTPVDDLRSVNSDLADRLVQVSQQLDHGLGQGKSLGSTEEEGQRYRALTSEWESIIKRVRSLPNFGDFMKPLKISSLMKAAQNGLVVIVNISQLRCDALALVPGMDKVKHTPLPNITVKRVTELKEEMKDTLYSNGIRMRGERAAKRVEDEVGPDDCEEILAELWSGLVKPVLDSLGLSPRPNVLPRIWWCATGPLAFLPIHAAGLYTEDTIDSQISSYAISSYIPTLSALLEAPNRTVDPSFKLLSVIQPSAPGVSAIPNTKKELKCIQLRIGKWKHVVLNGQEGTKERVMKAMSNSNWLHLACHGSQRQNEPTKSGLILEDGHLTLEEIIKLDLPNAEFAFLSACQTTTGEETLSDEAVHIAGGMLLAGYRGVVATMWSIQDDLAPEVADEFYHRIIEKKGRPDNRKAAEALHYSIQKLRKKRGIPFTSWIPFVHLGV